MFFINVLCGFFIFGFGYFAWDSRQVILNTITSHDKLPQLKEREIMVPIAEAMQKDLESTTVVVHKVNLVTNSRTTMFALNEKGIDCCRHRAGRK